MTQETEPKPASSTRAAIAAGLMTGLAFGFLDANLAYFEVLGDLSFVDWAGCCAATILNYSLVWIGVLLLVALCLTSVLKTRSATERFRILLGTSLGLGFFLELYWWSRPIILHGESALSAGRLTWAAVLLCVSLLLGVLMAGLLARRSRFIHVSLRLVGLLALLGGAVFLWTDRARMTEANSMGDDIPVKPNLLLVAVDGLRADHLGCYGSTSVPTPHLDALAESGVLVERCLTPRVESPATLRSILVGQARGEQSTPQEQLAARLHAAREGQLSAAFLTTSSALDAASLGSFDESCNSGLGHWLTSHHSRWMSFRQRLLPWRLMGRFIQRAGEVQLTPLVAQWCGENKGRPLFALVQFDVSKLDIPTDALPEEWKGAHSYGGLREFELAQRMNPNLPLTEETQHALRKAYTAAVQALDATVGELLTQLQGEGLLENTLVVVVGSQGEALGDGDGLQDRGVSWGALHLTQGNLHVPLLLSNVSLLPAGIRVKGVVESTDLMASCCDLLTVPREKAAEEEDIEQSLVPRILGLVGEFRASSTAQVGTGVAVQSREWKVVSSPERVLVTRRPDIPFKSFELGPGLEVRPARKDEGSSQLLGLKRLLLGRLDLDVKVDMRKIKLVDAEPDSGGSE